MKRPCARWDMRFISDTLFTMAGLDPATQPANVSERYKRIGSRGDAECAEFSYFSASSASSAAPREFFVRRADARLLGGRVKPGHGEFGLEVLLRD
jgi:hypothetical protein